MPEPRFGPIEGLRITESVAAGLAQDGITTPTPVQARAIASALVGDDVVMHSATGTGKTLAYVLPVLQRLVEHPDHRAVVLAPGPELAMQTLKVVHAYRDPAITTASAVSTSNRKRQRKKLTKGTRLIVGTPERVLTLFEQNKLKGVRILVIDELDPILASRRASLLDTWLSRSEPPLQKLVATATLGDRSEAFLARFLPDATRVDVGARPLHQAITHRVIHIGQGKDAALVRYVKEQRCRRAIVFATDPRQLAHLHRTLDARGVKSVLVSLDSNKAQRQQGLDAFRAGRAHVLLTSDAIARGLDVPDVDQVLHYDLPRAPEAYVHRAGRTGRAGAEGISVIFADNRMHSAVRRLGAALKIRFESPS